jgi:hypothetical protein
LHGRKLAGVRTEISKNPGKILLELIEVQTGGDLGEDDIIRIEDDYQTS